VSDLPHGWRSTTLGELGRYLNGRGFKKSEWRETGRPIIRIQNLTGSSDVFNHFDGEAEERYTARPGDLLVSWAATLGAYLWRGPEAVVNQHIFKVDSKIDTVFHKYLLDYKLAVLRQQTHGSGMVHITRGKFDATPVQVPVDISEQRRIVDVLEDHLSRLDAAHNYLLASRRRLDNVRRSAVWAALTGSDIEGRRSVSLARADTDDGDLPALPTGWFL
jgi:type I restriction enzyme S subunit